MQPIAGALSYEQLREIAPRVARLEASPAELTLPVGDTLLFVDGLVLTAFDSAGTALGRIHRFDFRLRPGAARLVAPVGIEGILEGTSVLLVSFPRNVTEQNVSPAQLDIPIKVTKKRP